MKLRSRNHNRHVSDSGRVASHYYATTVQSPATTRHKKSKLIYLRRALFAFIIIAGLVLMLSVSRHPSVVVDSQQYHSSANYKAAVEKLFSGVSNRSKLTINQAGLKAAIQRQFPEVEQVTITTPIYSRTAKVSLKVAPATFTLSGAPGTFGENVRYVIAANGKIVGLNRDFPTIRGLPNLTDQSGTDIKAGEFVLGQGTSSFILAIIAQCKKNNIPIESFNLSKTQEIDLRTKDKKYFVKFSLAADPATQMGQYLAAREQLAKTGEPSQYLDVRVDGRIYYQ